MILLHGSNVERRLQGLDLVILAPGGALLEGRVRLRESSALRPSRLKVALNRKRSYFARNNNIEVRPGLRVERLR